MMSAKYRKMDKFVNEMNQSVNIVGDMSVYLFSRFRNFVGHLFIAVTTIAIAFIVAEFVRSFQFSPINGVDIYFIALFISVIFGFYVAYYGEEAKIATIKGAIFSSGSNRLWQGIASFCIIIFLIMINAKGVQKIADFSFRYMDKQLQKSVVFQLKKKKMVTHQSMASSKFNASSQDSALKALLQTKDSYEDAKKQELKSLKQAYDELLFSKDPNKYRTYIATKKLEYSKKVSNVENRWSRKILAIDKKISKAQEQLNKRVDIANKMKENALKEADKATDELINHYRSESVKNQDIVDAYRNIGIYIAVGGEIVDGILAFLLFMIVKSNPNVSSTPQVQKNTRDIVKLKTVNRKKDIKISSDDKKSSKKVLAYPANKDLSNELFLKIKKVATTLATEHIKVGRNHYLKHPSQREIIKAFADYGVVVTPYQISEYFTRMGDDIMFVNQRIGFVYTNNVEKSAA